MDHWEWVSLFPPDLYSEFPSIFGEFVRVASPSVMRVKDAHATSPSAAPGGGNTVGLPPPAEPGEVARDVFVA